MDSGCSCLPGALRLNGSAAAAGGSTVRRVKLNFGNVARALNKLIIHCSPVSSVALQRWMFKAQSALDEIEAAHQAIGGARRGRRYATLQVNHAYAMLLSSQFQGFCRDLHSEAPTSTSSGSRSGVRPAAVSLRRSTRRFEITSTVWSAARRGDIFLAMTTSTAQRRSARVGSRVKLMFAGREVVATVIEDRGPVGMKGRRLLRVRLDLEDTSEPIELEIPAVDVKSAA